MKVNKSLKHLLVSQTRIKLIQQIFYYPQDIYYVRQLVRLVDEEINSVRRELQNLLAGGIVQSEIRGNRLFYWANPGHEFYSDLISLTHQTTGLGASLISHKEKIGQIKLILYSSDFSLNISSTASVDMIIVGSRLSLKEIEPIVKTEEDKRAREINYMVMDRSEFSLRKQKRDPFLVDFFLNGPIIIYGQNADISKL